MINEDDCLWLLHQHIALNHLWDPCYPGDKMCCNVMSAKFMRACTAEAANMIHNAKRTNLGSVARTESYMMIHYASIRAWNPECCTTHRCEVCCDSSDYQLDSHIHSSSSWLKDLRCLPPSLCLRCGDRWRDQRLVRRRVFSWKFDIILFFPIAVVFLTPTRQVWSTL